MIFRTELKLSAREEGIGSETDTAQQNTNIMEVDEELSRFIVNCLREYVHLLYEKPLSRIWENIADEIKVSLLLL